MAEMTPPTSGLSDWQLKLSYFYVSNKLLLRKLLILLLIAVNCALWGYSIAGVVFWAIDYNRLNQQTQNLMFSAVEVLPVIEAIRPKSLQISGVEAFGGNDNRFDLMADVVNPNTDWLATFNYAFVADNATTTYFPGFALPGQREILLDLGKESSGGELQITDIKWQKVTNFSSLKNIRDRFTVKDDEFIPAAKEGHPARVKFTVSNDSPFGYWEADMVVLLYSGSSVTAVNFITIPQFKSGDSRKIEMNWTRPLANIDGLEIIPEINYLDPANIMPPSSF